MWVVYFLLMNYYWFITIRRVFTVNGKCCIKEKSSFSFIKLLRLIVFASLSRILVTSGSDVFDLVQNCLDRLRDPIFVKMKRFCSDSLSRSLWVQINPIIIREQPSKTCWGGVTGKKCVWSFFTVKILILKINLIRQNCRKVPKCSFLFFIHSFVK